MSNRAIQRIIQGTAVAAALSFAGVPAIQGVAALQAIGEPAQQQPVRDQELLEPNEGQDYDMMDDDMMDDDDDDMTWGWVGLLGLAGLLGLRRRDDHRDDRHVNTTTRTSRS